MNAKKPLFVYGILRKKSLLESYLKKYDLKAIHLKPDTVTGYVPYHSNGINFVFPKTTKQITKYPNASFIVHGTLIDFIGEEKQLEQLFTDIDAMEAAYQKIIVTTKNGVEAYMYIMNNVWKRMINLYGVGLVLYPDTIDIECSIYPDNKDVEAGIKYLFGSST